MIYLSWYSLEAGFGEGGRWVQGHSLEGTCMGKRPTTVVIGIFLAEAFLSIESPLSIPLGREFR